MRRIATLTAVSCIGITPMLLAQTQQPTSRPLSKAEIVKRQLEPVDRGAVKGARQFRRLEVAGEDVARNVEEMTTRLRWHKQLKSALRSGREQGKPIVWIQALGDIDGFL